MTDEERRLRKNADQLERSRRYRATDKGRRNLKAAGLKWRAELKREVLVAYSADPPYCACCGETEMAFLTLDHINDDGAEHRKALRGAVMFYQHLRKAGCPNEPPLRVLCWNCNCGRRANGGTCPHEKMEHCGSAAEELAKAKNR